MKAGDQSISDDADATDSKEPRVVNLGQLALAAGERELVFKPEQPQELSVFEVVLKPVR